MKISIVGGGNMGGAIAVGLAQSGYVTASDITVIGKGENRLKHLKEQVPELNTIAKDYHSLLSADIVILALKPWLIEEFIKDNKDRFSSTKQILVSVAAGISLSQLLDWTFADKVIFRVIPNTAIAVKQSMSLIASLNANNEQNKLIEKLFSKLGKVEFIDEKVFSAATSLTSCGIAFAFRYIRAAMEGGIEMGIYPDQARDMVLQTLRGAVELLEANSSHPEAEIDKVTTPGGITIKGINEMEHAGFTSAVIRGLKASNVDK